MDKIINHAVLSLDFWQDTVTYEGCAMPTGTIGCEVLNISAEAIETLTPPCDTMNRLLRIWKMQEIICSFPSRSSCSAP